MEDKDSAAKTRYDLQAEFLADPVKKAYEFYGSSIDGHLQGLVHLANETGLEFGITLFTSGAIISGHVISCKKYFELFGKSMQEGLVQVLPDSDWEETAALYKSYGGANESIPDGAYKASPQYVHLRDMRVIGAFGGQVIVNSLWRGKIRDVSGFTLGITS